MGWIADCLALPMNMHRRLHRIRMLTPPKEEPESYFIDDPRPAKLTGMVPPKPPKMVSQVPPDFAEEIRRKGEALAEDMDRAATDAQS